MTLTNDNLLLEHVRDDSIGGVQRIYRFNNGYGLSAVNSPMLHSYPFAWEIAVLNNVSEDGKEFSLCYDSELTDDVEVFVTEEEANAFITKASKALS